MKKRISILLLTLTTLAALLTGCSSSSKPTLNVLNYGVYMDESLLTEFEKQNDVKVVYETYAAPEDMYTKVSAGGTNYDVIITGEYMIERMINEGLLHKLNFDNIPNFKFVGEQFKNQTYDPTNEYAVPYFWGTLGILYNKDVVDVSSQSWDILWDERYADRIIMIDSQRDAFAAALKYLGYSLNTTDEKELDEAKDLLIKQKPLVMAHVVDAAADMMIAGEADLALVWSGEATDAMVENDNLGFLVPKEGSNIWIDAMCIPETSTNTELAEKFINFMTDKDSTLRNIDEVMYSTVHTEAIKEVPAELKNNEAFNIPAEVIKKLEMFRDPKEFIDLYNTRWTEIMASTSN